jgi:hypothetical protein
MLAGELHAPEWLVRLCLDVAIGTAARLGGVSATGHFARLFWVAWIVRVAVRLPRFRCAACGGIEAGITWPSHCRSTPELDQLQAHLSAFMTYRTAADLLAQMFPSMPERTLRPYAVIL